jgi:hypothetical protein
MGDRAKGSGSEGKAFLLQEATQSALDGREEVLPWPRNGYNTAKRKGWCGINSPQLSL